VKVAFFGAHFLNDIQATNEFCQNLKKTHTEASWDSIAVAEPF
jgi:hypothetical protein